MVDSPGRGRQSLPEQLESLKAEELLALLKKTEAELQDLKELSEGILGGTGVHVSFREMKRARHLYEDIGGELRIQIERIKRILEERGGQAMKRNNVSVDRVEKTMAEFKSEPGKARRTQRVEGVWNFIEGKPQFSATVAFDGKSAVLEADQPSFLGGGATQPGPIIYCLFGLAACYAGTFATTAAMMGVELTSLKVMAENDINFSPVLGLSEKPPIERARLTIQASSPAPQAKLKEVETLANQRCPAVYCLTHPIPMETRLEPQSA